MYLSQYNKLINNAKLRAWPVDRSFTGAVYTEVHHIIPKCLGGANDSNNLVRLTGQEHFNAHCLLWKAYPDNHSLVLAAYRVSHINGIEINADTYNTLRSEHAKAISIKLTGIVRSKETIAKFKLAKAGKNNPSYGRPVCAKTRALHSQQSSGQKNGMYGKTHTPEVKENLSELHSGKTLSEWHISRIKESNTGSNNYWYGKKHSDATKAQMSAAWENRPTLICQHCGKSSNNSGNMNRWHFDNCKKKDLK